MKKIVLAPIKNEAWILEFFLKNVSKWADKIILADQNSTDQTRTICNAFEKVSVIQNNQKEHNNIVRWLLLDEARKYGNNNLLFFLDADELVSPDSVVQIEQIIKKNNIPAGTGFSFNWIQLAYSTENHRVDGIWKKNIKPVAFLDDGKIDFIRRYVINDHTERIPNVHEIIYTDKPLLHFNLIFKEKFDIKQVWYRCSEFIRTPKKARYINNKYSVMTSETGIFEKTHPEWFCGIDMSNLSYEKKNDWRYLEILEWFSHYGIKYFEPLDIWNVREFKHMYKETTKCEPVVKKYPKFIILLNDIKNKIRYSKLIKQCLR